MTARYITIASVIRQDDSEAKFARIQSTETLDVIPLFYPLGASVTRRRVGLNASVPSCLGSRQAGHANVPVYSRVEALGGHTRMCRFDPASLEARGAIDFLKTYGAPEPKLIQHPKPVVNVFSTAPSAADSLL